MSRNLIYATIFVVIGLIVGLNLQQPQSELMISPINKENGSALQNLVEANSNLQTRLSEIETRLTIEQNARQTLSENLESLKKSLSFNAPVASSIKSDDIDNFANNIETAAIDLPKNPVMNRFTNNKTQVLNNLGIDETITSRIQEREEKLEMDRLYLRNTAIREGWFGTEKYFEKTRVFNTTTNVYREELGDESYDEYLFNSNQNNRISVLSVISSSPAETAGLEKGDIIFQYDHVNVFSWSDLTKATTDGEAGQQVSIIIQRNKEEIELFVPRGPLGIRLENIKVNPGS